MKSYLIAFAEEFEYTEKAREDLLSAYRSISRVRDASATLMRNLLIYEKSGLAEDWKRVDEELQLAARYAALPIETVHLLFCILLTPQLRRLYEKESLDSRLFHDAMLDLKWKIIECDRLLGITGIMCFGWMRRWFSLGRFALGRLQYEVLPANRVIMTKSICLEAEDPILNMHIPSSGPLTREAVVDSYRQAKEFFTPRLDGKPAVVHCSSWLLFPKHKEILPQDSNIRRFCEDFELYNWGKFAEDKGDLWRIFYRAKDNPPEKLPRGTTLERAYADLLLRGEKTGWGSGILLPDQIKE